MVTYRDKLAEQLDMLQAKMQKIEAAENFDQTPEGAIIIDFITEAVNNLFEKMTSDEPLEREAYIKLHAQMALLRKLNLAIFAPVKQKDMTKRDIEDVQAKLREE